MMYVDGSPMDTHLCSSAIELPLHLGLSMSNAHMQRPFPRRVHTYPYLRLNPVLRARVCAWMCVCVCVAARCTRCKLRKSGNILARVLYGCVKMLISLYVCADRPCSHPPLHTYARVWARAAGRACGCCPCVHIARHPCVRYIEIYRWYHL